MSISLIKFAESFIDGRLNANVFANAYMELWKIERDLGIGAQDPANLSEVISSIFCIADLYNPEPDRDGDELDEKDLYSYIKLELEKIEGFSQN